MTRAARSLAVLYEDNHLLVVNKPAGLPTMGVASDRPSLLELAKRYLAHKYDKPGKVYLGIVSRLDAPVTGVVVMARTSKAASRLSEAFRSHAVTKRYLAVVEGIPEAEEQTLEHFLRKDERHRHVHVTHSKHPEAQEARLRFRRLTTSGDCSLLEVHLETGRKHQIRVQLAKIGHPILGDRKYQSQRNFPTGIALHAHSLELEHPVRREAIEFTAPLPSSWRKHRTSSVLIEKAKLK